MNGAILRDLEGLQVDLGVQSSVSLDDCELHRARVGSYPFNRFYRCNGPRLQSIRRTSSCKSLVPQPVPLLTALHATQTDHTALYLIGAVAPPIVQALVDQATLAFTQANIT